MLCHPEVANRSCEECAKWLYDEKTGRKVERGGQPLARPPGTPTPCWNCPKKSPQEAKSIELSGKNMRAYACFLMARAPLGDRLPADMLTIRNNAIIEQQVRYADALDRMRATYAGIGNAFVGALGGRH